MVALIANVTNRKVLSNNCKQLDPLFFRDDTHLNKNGRTLWSNVLAPFISDALKPL
ncbi:MAG: hypothetical protein ACI9J2_000561 [Saprospiraceae bacterium]|jgi:hypothetical protein